MKTTDPRLDSYIAKAAEFAKPILRQPPSYRKEYIERITEAKRDETRQERLATTLAWLADGEPRNWKYENC